MLSWTILLKKPSPRNFKLKIAAQKRMHPGLAGPDLCELLSSTSPTSLISGLALLDLRGAGLVLRRHGTLENCIQCENLDQFRKALFPKNEDECTTTLKIGDEKYFVVGNTTSGGMGKVVMALKKGSGGGVACWELPIGFVLVVQWFAPAIAEAVITRVSRFMNGTGLG